MSQQKANEYVEIYGSSSESVRLTAGMGHAELIYMASQHPFQVAIAAVSDIPCAVCDEPARWSACMYTPSDS